jgi:hypothetical protein
MCMWGLPCGTLLRQDLPEPALEAAQAGVQGPGSSKGSSCAIGAITKAGWAVCKCLNMITSMTMYTFPAWQSLQVWTAGCMLCHAGVQYVSNCQLQYP